MVELKSANSCSNPGLAEVDGAEVDVRVEVVWRDESLDNVRSRAFIRPLVVRWSKGNRGRAAKVLVAVCT